MSAVLVLIFYVLTMILNRILLDRIVKKSIQKPRLTDHDLTVAYLAAPFTFFYFLVVYIKLLISKNPPAVSRLRKIYRWFYFKS
jgi:hypothetical protein